MRINKLFEKEIISINDGSRLGEVVDLEFDEYTGELKEIVICGRFNMFTFLSKKDKVIIPWSKVKVIGDDTILVDSTLFNRDSENKSLLNSFFD